MWGGGCLGGLISPEVQVALGQCYFLGISSWDTYPALPQYIEYLRATADSFCCLGTGGGLGGRDAADSFPASYISNIVK